jgi:acyl dehydratase
MRMAELYPTGTRIALGSHLFAPEAIVHFASRFDPQPFHVDAEAARRSLFGGLCASGWHTSSAWMRTFIDHWDHEKARLQGDGLAVPKLGPSPGFKKLQWLRPVFADDTIKYFVTLTESRPLASRPGWILHSLLCEGENQDGIDVMRFESTVLEFE